ncbi:hypothetical protein ACFLWN_00785 [Chloroflexota bacterium]
MEIFTAPEFTFEAPSVISRARRVLIKPSALYPIPYPTGTSPELLATIISGIRQVSDADIILLEGTPGGGSIYPIYKSLGYNFPRVLMLDVKDCTLVEVDNPLPKPFAVPTFWVPNVILSSDYLLTITPLKTLNGRNRLSIGNLLSLLPTTKYGGEGHNGWGTLDILGIDRVLADLYFTLPFDLGIVEARQYFGGQEHPPQDEQDETETWNKIFMGEPNEIDRQIADTLGLKIGYLDLIRMAKVELELNTL